MLATAFGGPKSVLDDKGETTSYEAIGSLFRLGSDISRNALMRFQIRHCAIETKNVPFHAQLIGHLPRHNTRGVPFVGSRNQPVHDVFQME